MTHSGHQAQLCSPNQPHSHAAAISVVSSVRYLQNINVPLDRICLGIPVYGRSFLGVDSVGQQYDGHGGEEGTFVYKALPRPGTVEEVDECLGAAYCVGGDGGFVSYDNPVTVLMKADFVRRAGLGGLFYWHGTADKSECLQSLVATGFRGLHPAFKLPHHSS